MELGTSDGFDNSFEVGLAVGFEIGRGVGLVDGFLVGFVAGFEEGFAVGLVEGFVVGLGIKLGFLDGFTVGDIFTVLYSRARASTYVPLFTCIPITRWLPSKTNDIVEPDPLSMAAPIMAVTDDDPEHKAKTCPTYVPLVTFTVAYPLAQLEELKAPPPEPPAGPSIVLPSSHCMTS